MTGRAKRDNIHFRQTPREFKAQNQAEISMHFNKNLPYKIYSFSRRQFIRQIARMKVAVNKIVFKLPKESKRV